MPAALLATGVTGQQFVAGTAAGLPIDNPSLFSAGVTGDQYAAGLAAGVPLGADPACFGPYTEVPDDPALRASAGQGERSDWPNYDRALPSEYRYDDAAHGAFGAGAAAWYRLPPGRGLPTTRFGGHHCGTTTAGWLSGWHGAVGTAPDYGPGGYGLGADHYAVPADGALPPAVGLPPANGAVCFDNGGQTCYYPAAVRAVGCGLFALWDLPPVSGSAYCLAA
jgi:hypothetical protein